MSEPPAERVVYRNILLVFIRGGIILLPAVVITVSMIMYAATTLPHADATSKTTAAVTVLIAAALIWLAIRTIGSRITVTGEGLFVHTVFRRCQFQFWDSITGFELIRATRFDNRFTRSAVAIAVTRSHQHKPVYCLGASFSGPSPAADTMLRALQSEQRHRQPASSTTTR